MNTHDERLDFTRDRIAHLEEAVRTLARTRAPMETAAQPRVALGSLDPAEAAALDAALLAQVPQQRVGDAQSVLVLAAIARTQPVDIVVAVDPADAERLGALEVGLDGVVSHGLAGDEGPAVRRVRFGMRGEADGGARLAAIHLRLKVPGSVRLTRLAVEPAA